ncbi:MAG: ATP synthase F0 subunit B [Patescibacteria group bacterium]|nr:ATP synthase F0 subunit B [Patescibacteria group bacterium]MDE2438262.1 ATP synthase F0 subunit B [Patescibacteria group bacterium]
MKLLGSLGIDMKLLLAQIINFGLLVWVLAFFVYKPLIARIEKDDETLKKINELSDKLNQDKQAFAAEQQKEAQALKEHARGIVEEAEEAARKIKEQAYLETEAERGAILEQARTRLAEIENAEHHKK